MNKAVAWQQLIITTKKDDVDALSEKLEVFGPSAVTLRDAKDQPLFGVPSDEHPLWDTVDMVVLFDAAVDLKPVIRFFEGQPSVMGRVRVEHLPEQDWVKLSKDSFQAMQFGERLWVCPSWQDAPDPGAVNLIVDPGLAFGTGTHETTALCLEWLSSQDLAGKTVIDYGCGSGILGLAALKLGAAKVWAVDTDGQALTASRANAVRNPDIMGVYEVMFPQELPDLEVDIVMANILLNPLLGLVSRFSSLIVDDGRVILSGILENQQNVLQECYNKFFDFQSVIKKSSWLCLEGSKKNKRM